MTTELEGRATTQEQFAEPPFYLKQTSENLGWNAATLLILDCHASHNYVPGPQFGDDALVVSLSGVSHIQVQVHAEGGGLRDYQGTLSPGSISLVPRDTLFRWRWTGEMRSGFLVLSRPAFAAASMAVALRDPEWSNVVFRFNFRDLLLQQLLLALYKELQQQGMHGSMYADSITHTIMLHLLRHYSGTSITTSRARGKLTEAQRQQVEEYIHANLNQRITLAACAELLQISIPHFERLFRATYSMAPYQYLLMQRIEHAKLLLHDHQKSLCDVAHECGFANQSHFARQFKKVVGVTPTHFAHHNDFQHNFIV